MVKSKNKKTLVKLLENAFDGLEKCEEIDVDEAYRLSSKKVKVRSRHYPFQINLAPENKTIHVYPEMRLRGVDDSKDTGSYLLFDPEVYFSDIAGYYRLEIGDRITLAGDDEQGFLNIPSETPRRKLSIGNIKGSLTLKSHSDDPRSCVSPLFKGKSINRMISWRQNKLKKLKEIFGGQIGPLAPDDALELLKKVNKVMESEAYRPLDKNGLPGGVIALPEGAQVLVIGDLHAKPDNLLVVLSQNGILDALESGAAQLIILGDAVHPEGDLSAKQLADMESSMLMMDLIFQLKVRYPKNVFYIRGNHDSFSEEIAKQGVPQGQLWEKTLNKKRGKDYRKEMRHFYDQLAYVVYSKQFVACHAGPPVNAVSLDGLINTRDNPKLRVELITNRMKKPSRPGGYTKGDLKRFRKALAVAPDVPVILGHTPMSPDETLWENVGNIKNHHIVYGSDTHWMGVMIQIGDRLHPMTYPVEPLSDIINAL